MGSVARVGTLEAFPRKSRILLNEGLGRPGKGYSTSWGPCEKEMTFKLGKLRSLIKEVFMKCRQSCLKEKSGLALCGAAPALRWRGREGCISADGWG